jgi:hypothetical protein
MQRFSVLRESRLPWSRYWKNSRLEKHHPGDPPELSADPPVPPIIPATGRGCTCEFCGCRLTAGGEVLKLGESAKAFRKQDDLIEELKKSIDDLTKERDVLKAAAAAIAPKKQYQIG